MSNAAAEKQKNISSIPFQGTLAEGEESSVQLTSSFKLIVFKKGMHSFSTKRS